MSITVRHAPDAHRYELVDGDADGVTREGAVIGHTDYRELTGTRPTQEGEAATARDFLHTEVDEAYGGRGLAGDLVSFALADVKASGLRIVAHCPYVARWLGKHPGQYDDLVDPVS